MEAGALHATGKKIGLHSVRRFGTETLRRARVPEDLTKLRLGMVRTCRTWFFSRWARWATKCCTACESKSSVNESRGRFYYGAPGAIRTPDLVLRRHTPYP